MLEIIAAFLLIFWSLGLISGAAVSSAIHILPLVALIAIVLRVYDSVSSRAHAHTELQNQPVAQLHTSQAATTDAQRPAHEHAKAA